MDARDLLLDEHGRMHAAAVTGDKTTLATVHFDSVEDAHAWVATHLDVKL